MNNELNMPRASIYSLLASLYVDKALRYDFQSVITVLEAISNEPFIDEIKQPAKKMLDALVSDKDAVLDEFEELFNLPFGEFINSSVSFYHDEREFGEQTIIAKEIMHDAGYVKAEGFSLGEDDFGFLCSLSARLIKEEKSDLQKRVFHELLLPFIHGFLDAQLSSERAQFYKNAARFFALFIAFEKAFFEIHYSI